MKKTFLTIAAVMLFCMIGMAHADVYVEKSNKSLGDSRSGSKQEWITKMWISDSAIRIEESEGEMINIMDFQNMKLITLDSKNKEFFVIPLDQVQKDFVRETANLKRRMNLNWRVEEVEGIEEIAGYESKLFRFHGRGDVLQNKKNAEMKITMSLWVSDATPASSATSEHLLEVMGLDKNPFVSEAVLNELKRIGGFHMKAIIESEMDGKKQGIEQTVIAMSEIDASRDLYSIPSGYKEVSSPVNR